MGLSPRISEFFVMNGYAVRFAAPPAERGDSLEIAARPASRRATGTRNGEQET